MDNLPDDLIFNMIKYLSIWDCDILDYKNTSKRYYILCVKKTNIQINKIMSLKNESFFQKCMRYKILRTKLIDKLETKQMEMLLKRGWL
jgi:hypothetical protein